MKNIIVPLLLISQFINAQIYNEDSHSAEIRKKIAQFEAGLLHKVQIKNDDKGNMNLIERMKAHNTPGISIALINNNKIEWTKSYGVKSQGSNEEITSETLFQVASISKPITALATLRLVEEGSLSLDGPLKTYLNSWIVPENEFTRIKQPTIRDVLSHSGGFTNGSVGDYLMTDSIPTLLQALMGHSPSEKPPVSVDFVPGTKCRYSGGGYSVLQQLLIDHSNMNFSTLLDQTILYPLQMFHSFFQQPLSSFLMGFTAKGHDDYGHEISGGWTILPEMAAGGLWSTSLDLSKIIIEVNRSFLGESDKILSRTMTQEMLQRQKGDYGLGFQIEGNGNELIYSHTGSNEGYRAYFVGYPRRRQGVVILTNSNAATSLRWEIMRSLSKIYDFPNFKQVLRFTKPPNFIFPKDLVGVYEFEYSNEYVIKINNRKNRIFAKLNEDTEFEILPEAENIYFSLENTLFEFHLDSEHTYVTITLDSDTPYKWFKKKK